MKSLVLAEKPSVGRELGRVLGCSARGKTHMEGKDYIVTWAMGHLVELADPSAYDEKYKSWKMDYLPMLPERMKHKVIGRTSRQFNMVKSLLKRNDVNHLIIATDAGREGELVARWIMKLSGWKGKTERLWISSQTDTAIKQGFKNLKPGKDYENLFRAAECRAESDWVVGLNLTRALSCKWDARLSAGRVQTPTLAIMAGREKEIENFKPRGYWTITADFGPYTGLWQGEKGLTRFSDQNKAREIAGRCEGKTGKIVSIKKKNKSVPPPLAYDLTDLQREANRRLGWSAKKTLQVLQGLYERHKIVSYPRTDSRYITSDMEATLKERLYALKGTPFEKPALELAKKSLKPGKRLINDAGVSDHHAIIPTEEPVRMDRLDGEEKSLWNLIAMRYLAVLSTPEISEKVEIVTAVGDDKFITRGSRVLDRGWRAVEHGFSRGEDDDADLSDQRLKEHKEGETLAIDSVKVKQGMTKPPARYTEGTLLSVMENPGRFVKDKEIKEGAPGFGLGTPATRADIIEKLIANYYIERRGKELVPTGAGMQLLKLVPEEMTSPELTARWEARLDGIAKGREKSSVFIVDIREYAKKLVNEVKTSKLEYKPDNLTTKPCPLCGKRMMKVHDKKGRELLVCQSRSCGYEDEGEDNRNLYGTKKPSRREQSIARSMIKKVNNEAEESGGFTLADMMNAKKERRRK
ncbi:MAG: DNA topoisomerase III [Spirochaetales bacterium]|nr:DNA topoisomerase III [Spirochaetales bacterium]